MPAERNTPKRVACPTCGGESVYAPSNRWRPFCSERCRNIDLGAWASEQFRVPTQATPDDHEFGDPKRADSREI